MPPVAAIVGAAAATAAATIGSAAVAGTVITTTVIIKAAVLAAISAGLAALQFVLTSEPKSGIANSAAADREAAVGLEIDFPAASRRLVYGERRIGGIRRLAESTSGNRYLHLVFALCEGPVQGIPIVLLDDYPVYESDLDGDGLVTVGKYAGLVRIKKHLGTSSQAADADLVSEISEWTTAHRLRGVAYIYVRYEYDRDVFGSGRPAVSAVVQGLIPGDPREGTSPETVAWTPNAALCLRDYALRQHKQGGIGMVASEIDDAQTLIGANVCDEIVATAEVQHTVTSVNIDDDTFDLDGDVLQFQTGDQVRLSSSGTVPDGASTLDFGFVADTADSTVDYGLITDSVGSTTDYGLITETNVTAYVIAQHYWKRADDDVVRYPRVKLASSLENAYAGTALNITSSGSGLISLTKTGEPRYTVNFVVDTTRKPADIVKDMLVAMAGRFVFIGGVWKIKPGAWETPTVTFTEDHLRGAISTPTKRSRRERFNALQGQYQDPRFRWQPSNYPAMTSAVFELEDKSERIFGTLDMPAVTRGTTAQRLAKIELWRHRRQIRARLPLTLAGLQVEAGGTCSLDNTVRGWSAKTFEVESLNIVAEGGSESEPPFLGVDLECAELDSAVFDWDESSEEQAVAAAPRSNLPNPSSVSPPTAFVVSTEEVDGVPHLSMRWDAPSDAFVDQDGNYDVQIRRSQGRALSFDGVNDSVAMSTALDFSDFSAWTFECWVEWAGAMSPDQDGTIFNNGQFRLYRRASDGLVVATLTDAASPTGVTTVASTAALATDFTHLAVTYDGSTVRLIVNGSEDDSESFSGTLNATVTGPDIGRGDGATQATDYFAGKLDDLRIWTVAKGVSEISANKNAALTGGEAGLRVYWPCDVATSQYVYDRTSNQSYGTLAGATFSEGTVPEIWQPAAYIDALNAVARSGQVPDTTNHDVRIRARSRWGAVSAWQYIFGYQVGSPSAGAAESDDWGLYSEALTEASEDWSDAAAWGSVSESEDWGAFV